MSIDPMSFPEKFIFPSCLNYYVSNSHYQLGSISIFVPIPHLTMVMLSGMMNLPPCSLFKNYTGCFWTFIPPYEFYIQFYDNPVGVLIGITFNLEINLGNNLLLYCI